MSERSDAFYLRMGPVRADNIAACTLVEEATRIIDRLDKLDRILSGDDSWLSVSDGRVEFVIDKPLAEARQQAATLKSIIAELRQMRSGNASSPGVNAVDQLAERRANRVTDAAD